MARTRYTRDDYIKMLDEKLKPAVPTQRRGQLVGGLLAAARRITKRPTVKPPIA